MSGGGGQQVSTSEPWAGVQPYLNNQYQGAWNLYHQGPKEFFPGQTFADPTQQQLAPWNYGMDYVNQAFGTNMQANWQGPQNYGQPQQIYDPSKGPTTAQDGTVTNHGNPYQPAALPGGGGQTIDMQAGKPGQGVGDIGMPTPGDPSGWQSFGSPYSQPGGQPGGPMAPNFGAMVGANQQMLQGGPGAQLANQFTPGAIGALNQGFNQLPVSAIGEAGFDPSLGDPRGAINQMLSGTPQYDKVQEAVRAGAQPSLDMLFEDVMPQLRSRTVGSGGNNTGEIKDLNRIVPRVMRDISNQGIQAGLGEYNRAMGSQERGAGLAGSLGMQGGQLGLQGDIAEQQAINAFRNAGLGYGNLGLGATGQMSNNMQAGVGQFGDVFQQGLAPFAMGQGYGDFTGKYENAAVNDAMNRWNFNEQAPYDLMNWYSGQLSGAGGLGGTTTQSASSNPLLGAAGGALAGAAIPGMLGPGGMGLMAANPAMWPFVLGGGLLGAFG